MTSEPIPAPGSPSSSLATSSPDPSVPAADGPAAERPAARRLWGRAVLVLGSAAVLWFAWLGWDTSYDVDPATGRLSGPYAWWQVAGFVFSAAGLVLAARRVLPALPVVAAAALGITGGFALSARSDDSGLAGIGVVLILLGSSAGGALLLSLARLATGRGPRQARVLRADSAV